MESCLSAWPVWMSLAVQTLAVTSLVIARLAVRPAARQCAHAAFYLLMVLLVTSVVGTLLAGSGSWVPAGATLGFLCVGATLDFRREPEPAGHAF